MWPADRVQIALQAIVLRENGYECDEAIVFYQKTRQRVRVPVDAALIAEAEEAVARAWELAEYGLIPRRWKTHQMCGLLAEHDLSAGRDQSSYASWI